MKQATQSAIKGNAKSATVRNCWLRGNSAGIDGGGGGGGAGGEGGQGREHSSYRDGMSRLFAVGKHLKPGTGS